MLFNKQQSLKKQIISFFFSRIIDKIPNLSTVRKERKKEGEKTSNDWFYFFCIFVISIHYHTIEYFNVLFPLYVSIADVAV